MSGLKVINPFDQSVYFESRFASWQEVEEAVSRACDAFADWRCVPVPKRVRLLQEGMGYFNANREQVATDVTKQMGKPIAQSRREIDTMLERSDYMCSIAKDTLAPDKLPAKENFELTIMHEPLGVVLDIAAWNYPLLIAVNVIVPALLAGDVVLIKHSSQTPLCGEHFAGAVGKLGGHAALVQNLVLDHRTAERLVSSGLVDYVSFTGSVKGGHEIYSAASRNFIDAGLELGGKDPAYVARDADIDFAVENIVDGAMYNAGQSCCGIERVYVHVSLHDSFIEKAQRLVAAYRLGNPLSEETDMGPLALGRAVDVCEEQVADAVARGARIVQGGKRSAMGIGNFFVPTLVVDITENSWPIMQEENFGPVLPIMKVESDEEALRLMNDSSYGLTASVWTRSLDLGRRFARILNAGTVFMNRCDYLDPALPWTGTKDSGKGVSLSKYGFYALTRRKSIHLRVRTSSG